MIGSREQIIKSFVAQVKEWFPESFGCSSSPLAQCKFSCLAWLKNDLFRNEDMDPKLLMNQLSKEEKEMGKKQEMLKELSVSVRNLLNSFCKNAEEALMLKVKKHKLELLEMIENYENGVYDSKASFEEGARSLQEVLKNKGDSEAFLNDISRINGEIPSFQEHLIEKLDLLFFGGPCMIKRTRKTAGPQGMIHKEKKQVMKFENEEELLRIDETASSGPVEMKKEESSRESPEKALENSKELSSNPEENETADKGNEEESKRETKPLQLKEEAIAIRATEPDFRLFLGPNEYSFTETECKKDFMMRHFGFLDVQNFRKYLDLMRDTEMHSGIRESDSLVKFFDRLKLSPNEISINLARDNRRGFSPVSDEDVVQLIGALERNLNGKRDFLKRFSLNVR